MITSFKGVQVLPVAVGLNIEILHSQVQSLS
jgi:hypothetical protein